MLRSALFLSAGLLVALCFACIEVPAPPTPPTVPILAAEPAPHSRIGLQGCNPGDGKSFANAVQVLAPGSGYDPQTLVPPPANMLGTLSNTTQIWSDLVAGFNAAPANFRIKLCNLTAVYIDTTTCPGNPLSCFGANSWGFRNPNNTDERYLALSQSIWGSIGQLGALRYSVYETNLLAQVMLQEGMPWPSPPPIPPPPGTMVLPPPPAFSPAMNGNSSVDTAALTVLAALAHEYGHILWYDVLKAPHDNNYKPSVLCRPDPNKKGDGFFDDSWGGMDVNQPKMWLGFGETMGDQHAPGITQISSLKQAIRNSDFQTAASLLNSLYAPQSSGNPSGVWPSLFGAISPEEDFVETFKVFILTRPETNAHMPITTMRLNIFADTTIAPQPPVVAFKPNIFADLNRNAKKVLATKMACLNRHF
jgi:hypothetical protein